MELATTPMTADKQVKRHPIVQEMQESIQAFRAIGAEIELQPILDYLASRELREAGSGNILASRLLDRGVDGGGVWIHESLHQPPSALIHRRRTFPPLSRPPA